MPLGLIPQEFTPNLALVRALARREAEPLPFEHLRQPATLWSSIRRQTADGLLAVFFSAPAPSGRTWTLVLSSDIARSGRARSARAQGRNAGPRRHCATTGSSSCTSYASYRSASEAHATCTRARPRTAQR